MEVAQLLSGGAPLGVLTTQQSVSMNIWQGQFPPPDVVEVYERIQSGAFDRLISMAETQMRAQIEASADVRRRQSRDIARGHYLGTAVTVAAMIGAGVCARFGQPWVAGVFLGVPVLSVARTLIESVRMKPQPAASALVAAAPTAPEPPKPS